MFRKALIFDFDNTLAENIDITDHDILQVLNKHKKIANTAKALRAIRAAHSDFRICLDFLGAENAHSAYEQIVQINKIKVLNSLYKMEVMDAVKHLSQKYSLFIVSGRDISSLMLSINSVGLDFCFQDIIGDVPYQLPKPHPAVLLSLFKNYGLNQDDCIYIGDSYTDFIFSKAANCRFIGAAWYKKDIKISTDYICEIPKSLEDKINWAFRSD